MTKEEYLASPCRASSLSCRKSLSIRIPDQMRVIRDDLFDPAMLTAYEDAPYFKAVLYPGTPQRPVPEKGYLLSTASFDDLAGHIMECYGLPDTDRTDLAVLRKDPCFDPSLWIRLSEKQTGRIIASGIAAVDPGIREGVLEWIQVSSGYRRKGFGTIIVRELIARMNGSVDFITVSGSLNDPCGLLAFYESCGFTDACIWHILRRKHS